MRLIEDTRAPNPRRVRIFLREKGVDVESEPVDIMALGHRTKEIVRLNPFAALPILVLDDGTVLTESVAICRYFEALHPDPPLMGTGALGAAWVEMWQRRVEFAYFAPVAYAVRHLHPRFEVLESPQIAAWGELNKPRVLKAIAMLDAALAETRFIAGDAFTVADITAIVATEFMRIARIERTEPAPHFDRWWAEVSARPSVAATGGMTGFDALLGEIRGCRACVEAPRGRPLPHGPRPVLRGSATARILVAGQAPGTRVHASGVPFTDPSGDRLRDWMGIDAATFYDESRIAIVPMGFCFPGLDARGGDLPPRRECAPLWRARVLAALPELELVVAVGMYALKWHLGPRAGPSLAATLADWRAHLAATPPLIALPHPSWRNNAFLRRHPEVEAGIVPELRRRVAALV